MPQISDYSKIHLIGIGGCSMNGLAQILSAKGYQVQGSDITTSPFTARLTELGIPVMVGHSADNLMDADLVVYSAAIKPDNPERKAARERGVPELERSVALGQLSREYKTVLGVAGCHGKTTITSMLALIAERGCLDATVHIGGFIESLNGGVRMGTQDIFITEACEYVESFLTLRPTIAIINNIDDDHLDYFKDIDHITDAFRRFIGLLPADGVFIGCTDDPRVRLLMSEYGGRKISYGMEGADYCPANITYGEFGNPGFNLLYRGDDVGRIQLEVIGEHNIINAVAAAAAAITLGEPFETIAGALKQYRPARRRFEFYGERLGVKYFHDYAHHPSEISAVLSGASRCKHGKLYCVFQCNSYTRAKTLFCGQVTCFKKADTVFVPDIYPGREKDDGAVHARDLAAAIKKSGVNAIYLPTFDMIRDYLDEHAQPGDMVVTLGSGDVYKQTETLL